MNCPPCPIHRPTSPPSPPVAGHCQCAQARLLQPQHEPVRNRDGGRADEAGVHPQEGRPVLRGVRCVLQGAMRRPRLSPGLPGTWYQPPPTALRTHQVYGGQDVIGAALPCLEAASCLARVLARCPASSSAGIAAALTQAGCPPGHALTCVTESPLPLPSCSLSGGAGAGGVWGQHPVCGRPHLHRRCAGQAAFQVRLH